MTTPPEPRPPAARPPSADDCGHNHQTEAEAWACDQATNDRAVDWLLRLRQLRRDGLSFDDALAQANAELGEPTP